MGLKVHLESQVFLPLPAQCHQAGSYLTPATNSHVAMIQSWGTDTCRKLEILCIVKDLMGISPTIMIYSQKGITWICLLPPRFPYLSVVAKDQGWHVCCPQRVLALEVLCLALIASHAILLPIIITRIVRIKSFFIYKQYCYWAKNLRLPRTE